MNIPLLFHIDLTKRERGGRLSKPLIEVKNVNKVYGSSPAKALELIAQGESNETIRKLTKQSVGVRGASFTVDRGEIFVIMGLSGSGKSTLLRCINRLHKVSSGEVWVDGQNICTLSTKELNEVRRKKLAMVFQKFALLPHRTVLENVAYGLEIQHIPKEQRKEKAMETIQLVGLDGWENSYPHSLSGGMQQRVGLARALANDAEILLMDEPFSALDPLIRQDMQEELMDLQKTLRKTILFITHDLDEALKLGDRIALMKDGKIVQIGQPEDILLSPEDEYVERFTKNADRSKALTAASVMVRPRSIVYPKDGLRMALREMENHKISGIFVIDKDGVLLGHLSAEQASELNEQGERDLFTKMDQELKQVLPETPLHDVLESIAHSRLPIAVTDEQGRLKGVLIKGAVLAGLAGSQKEGAAL